MSYDHNNGFNYDAINALSFFGRAYDRIYSLEAFIENLIGFTIPVIIGDFFDPKFYTFAMAANVNNDFIIINEHLLENMNLARAIIAHEIGHLAHFDRNNRRVNNEGILDNNFMEVEADEFSISHTSRESGEELVRFLNGMAALIPNLSCTRRARRQLNTRINSARQNIRRYYAA